LLLFASPLAFAAAPPAAETSLALRARAVLAGHCAACHGGADRARGGFGYVLDRDRLVEAGQVVPGKPRRSPLYQRIADGEMPPAKRPRPSADELATLRRWIESGAPALPAPPPVLIAESEMLRRVRADLQSLPPRQRRFTRYLTLHHLAALSAADLQTHRHALAKLVNSLSWHPRLRLPLAVDPARTIYRIDLRSYKWSARLWDRLANTSPYRLPEPSATAQTIAKLTESEQPIVRADWFIATASRPPFYHDFLQLPATDRGLERLLQVDVPANLEDDNAVRAGFNGSGVARSNRLIERHDAAHGAYWRSYDFSDNTGRQNLFERPLGPAPGPHGFVHAGGEAIFNLPNGLQAYLLFDGDGRRVDKAPSEIVSDPARPDRRVENGVSCIGCHARGIIPKDDQVRAHVLKNARVFDRAARDAVLALYPPPARMRRLMKEDAERFLGSLRQLGVPDVEKEVVSAVVLTYEAALDLRTVAAALGVNPDVLTAQLRRSPELARTLGPLLARGGTIQRQVFEEAFAQLARDLRLGADTEAPPVAGAIVLRGHRGAVRALALSADGRFAVSGGEDGTVRVWDLVSGRERRRFVGHRDEVNAVAFAPDGKHVLSGGADRTVRVWNVSTGREVHKLAGHTDAVRSVAVSRDGRYALSGGEDRAVRLWDLEKGTEVRALGGHGGPVTALTFSADGKRALSGGHDRLVRLWEVPSGKLLGRWEGHTGAVYAVAFSRDGKQALSGGADRSVRRWDVSTGRAQAVLTSHANAVVAVAFAGDGKHVVSGASRYDTPDRAVRRWLIATGREVGGMKEEAGERIEAIALRGDGACALLSGAGGVLRLRRER
jgi:mono/diheme cytochrome c family protein